MATFDDYIIRISERGAKETANAIGGIGKESERTTGFVAGLNRTLFALASAFSVKSLLEYTSTWQSMTNTLKIVTKDAKELTEVQERLFKQAQNNRTSVEALTDLYQKLRMSQKEVGVSGENLFKVTDVVSKAMTVAGKSGQAATNGLRQFVQGLVSGKLQGEELRSVLENTPYLAKTLADGLRVPVGALRELGAAGKLTSEQVVRALLSMQQTVNKDFAKTSITISQAMTVLENAFMRFVGQSGEVSTASSIIAQGIVLLANNIDKLAIALGLAAGAWVAYRVAVTAVAAAQWLANAAIAANPIVRMVTIIAGVIAALSLLTTGTEGFTKTLKAMGEAAVSVFKWVTDGISTVIGWFGSLNEAITTTSTSITSGVTEAFDGVMNYLKSWYDWLIDLFSSKMPKAFSDAVNSVVQFFKDGFNAIQEFVSGVVDSITGTIKRFVDQAMSWFQKLIQAAREAANSTSADTSSRSGEFGGARAAGGSVMRGRTYLVGENGPELWTASANGYIIPNGGTGGSGGMFSNDNYSSRSYAEDIAEGFREALGEQFTELLDVTSSNNNLLTQIAENTKQLSSTVSASAASAAASGNVATGISALNNFGIPAPSQMPETSASSVGSRTQLDAPSTSGGGGTPYVDPQGHIGWGKKLLKYFYEEDQQARMGVERTYEIAKQRTLAFERSIPEQYRDAALSYAVSNRPAKMVGATIQFRNGGQIPAFATGGSFTIPGSTGVDSKLVNMRVSPGEQVDVRTRKQVREEQAEQNGRIRNNNVTFNIQTSDADSFRRSKKQINRQLMRELMRDAS